MTDAVSLACYERLAAAVLPGDVRDFVAGGSGAERTLRLNRTALDAVSLVPRVLAGFAEPDLSGQLLGTPAAMPVAVAPMAYQRLVNPEGERALAMAAAEAGVPYVISTLSSYPLEQIAAITPSIFQLYWLRDRGLVESLIDRAAAAGCTALMVTVDVPRMGRRLRDLRNSFALPAEVAAANLVDPVTLAHSGLRSEAHAMQPGQSAVAAHTASAFAPAFSWKDLEWLAGRSPLPLVVKGILDPRDARTAVDLGATGIVVSNHGGRQLDGAVASIEALPHVVEAVGATCEVLLDSGVRSGTDVLRALALGASGVLIGRPLLWALALNAAPEALSLLSTELSDALHLTGCPNPAAATKLQALSPTNLYCR